MKSMQWEKKHGKLLKVFHKDHKIIWLTYAARDVIECDGIDEDKLVIAVKMMLDNCKWNMAYIGRTGGFYTLRGSRCMQGISRNAAYILSRSNPFLGEIR